MEEKRAYIPVVYFLQTVLYLPYLWLCFSSVMTSQTLRELQRNPEPVGTPLDFLLYSVASFAITTAILIMFLLIAKKLKMMTKPLLLTNIILPCIVVFLRFIFFSIWFFGLSDELVYSFYINFNEIAFFTLNALIVAASMFVFPFSPLTQQTEK